MSWYLAYTCITWRFRRGFKKGVHRAGTMFKQKTGMAEKTIDTNFEQEATMLRRNRAVMEEQWKEYSQCLESVRALVICRTLMAFHNDSEQVLERSRKLEDYFCTEYVPYYAHVTCARK
jgi:hypothetical protein